MNFSLMQICFEKKSFFLKDRCFPSNLISDEYACKSRALKYLIKRREKEEGASGMNQNPSAMHETPDAITGKLLEADFDRMPLLERHAIVLRLVTDEIARQLKYGNQLLLCPHCQYPAVRYEIDADNHVKKVCRHCRRELPPDRNDTAGRPVVLEWARLLKPGSLGERLFRLYTVEERGAALRRAERRMRTEAIRATPAQMNTAWYHTRPRRPDFRLRERTGLSAPAIPGGMSRQIRMAAFSGVSKDLRRLFADEQFTESLRALLGNIHYNIFLTVLEWRVHPPEGESREHLRQVEVWASSYVRFLDGEGPFPSLPADPESLWFLKDCRIDPLDLQKIKEDTDLLWVSFRRKDPEWKIDRGVAVDVVRETPGLRNPGCFLAILFPVSVVAAMVLSWVNWWFSPGVVILPLIFYKLAKWHCVHAVACKADQDKSFFIDCLNRGAIWNIHHPPWETPYKPYWQ